MWDEELKRLEGDGWPKLSQITDAWKMWKRSYLVALNAIHALERRVDRLQRTQWDSPVVFFYPEEGESDDIDNA